MLQSSENSVQPEVRLAGFQPQRLQPHQDRHRSRGSGHHRPHSWSSRAKSAARKRSTSTAASKARSRMPESRVTIGRNGKVDASIQAREVVIMGKVTGNIECSDRVDIRARRLGQRRHFDRAHQRGRRRRAQRRDSGRAAKASSSRSRIRPEQRRKRWLPRPARNWRVISSRHEKGHACACPLFSYTRRTSNVTWVRDVGSQGGRAALQGPRRSEKLLGFSPCPASYFFPAGRKSSAAEFMQ